jgi:hypothetical protein
MISVTTVAGGSHRKIGRPNVDSVMNVSQRSGSNAAHVGSGSRF